MPDPVESGNSLGDLAANAQAGAANPQITADVTAGGGGGAAPAPVVATQPHHSVMGKIYDTFLDALGGKNDISYKQDDKGKLVPVSTPRSHGEQWDHILAGAFTGLAAAGKIQGPARKNPIATFASGAAASSQKVESDDADAKQAAIEDSKRQRDTMLFKANMAKLDQDITAGAFELTRRKVDADTKMASDHKSFMDSVLNGDPSNVYLGVAHSVDDLMQKHSEIPGLLKAHTNAQIVTLPHVGADGKYDGAEYAMVTPEWGERMITSATPLIHWVPDAKGGLKAETVTMPAGSIRNKDLVSYQKAEDDVRLKWDMEQSKEKNALNIADARERGESARAAEHERREDARQDVKDQTQPVYAFDPKQNRLVQTNMADAKKRNLDGAVKVNEDQISKDRSGHAVLNDIQKKLNRLYDARGALDQGAEQTQMISQMITQANNELSIGAHNSALGIAVPSGGITNWLERHWLSKDLSQQSRDYIIAHAQAKEAVMGYQKLLTNTGRTNETQLQALVDQIPAMEPDSKMAAQKLYAFQEQMDAMRQKFPKITGMDEVQSVIEPRLEPRTQRIIKGNRFMADPAHPSKGDRRVFQGSEYVNDGTQWVLQGPAQ